MKNGCDLLDGADAAAFSGDVLVTGALASTETGNDTAQFLGAGAAPIASGILSATEGGLDAFAASGNIIVSGALASTETGSDTAAFTQASTTLTQADLDAIAAAVWAHADAVSAHAKLDGIITSLTC